ncbi:replication-associated recombination protein A [Poriferisphaera sp. WC338]|uniref:replication-associated recombination protein A n=1 Tax=Poriferisphaera sp. WC338 TaxID=3425129 RepID=UPI003D81BC11
MSGLWDEKKRKNRKAAEPLAVKMRPKVLEEFAGQKHFLGEGKLLRRMLEADQITSVIFYGPPGTGKTTLAELIAQHTKRRFERANAAAVGVKDVREVLDRAKKALENDGVRTIFFLDEIHRFNKSQQDVLLGDVERGVITLIGATTENPFFSVNSALVSRSQIFQFESLDEDEVKALIRRAIEDEDRGYGEMIIEITDEAMDHWAVMCDGDARRALSALEIAVLSSKANVAEKIVIDLEIAQDSIQQKAVHYDAKGDGHYDAISAFIKSVRGSDPDAAVYWLAKMLVAGEDPMFIARRVAILASEDIGNADPRGIQVAAAAYEITHRIGMPECQLTLAQAAIYLACAPKSNASAMAIWTAMSDVKKGRTVPVPKHLRDGHYAGAKKLGHTGYQYAHDSESGVVDQEYLGVDVTYYEPVERGFEVRIGEFLKWVAELKHSEAD